MAPTRVAGYLRVSTEEQADDRFSIGAQRDRIIAMCGTMGWLVCDIYCDEGVSGATLDRPELSRMLADARARKFDVVLVWKVDRLSRKVAHLSRLVEDFESLRIAFRSVTEPFDTGHPAGKAFLQMLSVFAEFERESIRERSSLGIRRRIEQGFAHGRRPFGYLITAGKLEIEPKEAAIVRFMYDQYLQGTGSFRLAEMLKLGNIPNLSDERLRNEFAETGLQSLSKRIRDILENPAYAGYAKVGNRLCPDHHEAIVPSSIWERAVDIRSHRHTTPWGQPSFFLLSGRVFCGVCGGAMTGRRMRNRSGTAKNRPFYEYYACINSTQNAGLFRTCNAGMIAKHTVEDRVLAETRGITLDDSTGISARNMPCDPALTELQYEQREIKASLSQLERDRREWLRAFEGEEDVDLGTARKVRDLTKAAETLKRRLSDLSACASPKTRSEKGPSRQLANLAGTMRAANEAQLYDIVRTFVRRVVIVPTEERSRGNRVKRVQIEFFPH